MPFYEPLRHHRLCMDCGPCGDLIFISGENHVLFDMALRDQVKKAKSGTEL